MAEILSENHVIENQIEHFICNYSIGKLLHQSNVRKQCGISLEALLCFERVASFHSDSILV